MSKKAQIFPVFLLMMFILTMVYALVMVNEKGFSYSREPIGVQQLAVIDMAYEGEKVLNYIDTSAGLALNDAMHEFAETGGVGKGTDCRRYLGYTIWDDSCSPSEENFKGILEDSVNRYLSQYPIPPLSFTIEISGANIKGISNEPVDVNLLKPEAVREGKEKIIKAIPSLDYSGEGIVPVMYTYDDCTAFDYFPKGKHLTKEQFKSMADSGELVSISSELVDFSENPKTNVMTRALANEVLALSKIWNNEQKGRSRIQAYSVCTGKHSENSDHNIGRAFDITGCYGSDGAVHDFKCINPELTKNYRDFKCSEDDVRIAKECYTLFKSFQDHFTGFIGPLDCTLDICKDPAPRECSKAECDSLKDKCKKGTCRDHYNHLHLEK
ncbi:MAG TPA: hypothetical protein VJI46_01560 [Candidatus Nanoarchaeia archaeon]|nr:hypothetical protein [Candidatus Nanoarchaeia archaeon]